ncbi:hypothetical protein DFH94DRAFT_842889 [Russula ochroleuca]|uniref:Uncharacterized protein n=1 Tax=Russula ochroleuca TaxID=152965 RepID=A0A9P5TCZ1_9AGAM|nr:hypothetical protein DFH94DRAFT_842889 [Russula ochroleuca]
MMESTTLHSWTVSEIHSPVEDKGLTLALTLTHAPLTLVFRAWGAKDPAVVVVVVVAVGEYVSAMGQGTEKKWMQILVPMKMKRSIVKKEQHINMTGKMCHGDGMASATVSISSSLVQGCSDVGLGSGGSGSGSVEVEDANVGWSGCKWGRESITTHVLDESVNVLGRAVAGQFWGGMTPLPPPVCRPELWPSDVREQWNSLARG